jgi:hypothetical protein
MLFVVAVVLLPSLLADVRGRAPAARGLDDTTGLIQRILKRRRRSALHIAAFAGAGFAAAVIFALILVSGELALCYAGPSLLFAFSDGALVIAIGKTGPTAWGESGWWTQSPMIDPMLGFPSQFGAPIRVIPLVLPFLALFATAVFPVAWVACTMDRDTKKSAKAVGVMISLVLALFWFRHHDKLSFRLALFGTVAIPTIMLLAADRLRRAHSDESDGYCAQCGYNLTGNTSGICPECGRRIPADVIIPPPQILAQGPVEVAENR